MITSILCTKYSECGIDVNAEETKQQQNEGRKHNIKVRQLIIFFGKVARFKCSGMKVTNENYSNEGVKSRLNLGGDCYH